MSGQVTAFRVLVKGTDPEDAKQYVEAMLDDGSGPLEVELIEHFPDINSDASAIAGGLSAFINHCRLIKRPTPDGDEKRAWIEGVRLALATGYIKVGGDPTTPRREES